MCSHVYPSYTVYPVYPYTSCVPMLTLVSLYTLYTLVYSVYPCLPKSFCILADNSSQDHHIAYTYRRTPLLGLEPVLSDWIKSVFCDQ